MKTIEQRFWEKVQKTDGCWVWTAGADGWNYGHIWLNRKLVKAHKLSYLWHKGEIAKGLFVCHSCDNTRCVNPAHLFLGTAKENSQDMVRKYRGHKGKRKGVLLPDRYAEAFSLRDRGLTQPEIAKHFDISVWKLRRILWTKYPKHYSNRISRLR